MSKGIAIFLTSTALVGTFAAGMIVNNVFKDEGGSDLQGWTKLQANDEQPVQENGEKVEADKKVESKTPEDVKKSDAAVKGTYRCWSFNVAGVGGQCSSPPIILYANGTYSMSSEKGTYAINGDQIVLSESKIRGPGTFKEGRKQIVFNYTYNGKATTATYLNYDDPENNTGKMIGVKLNLIFAEGDDRARWLSSISLSEVGEVQVYDAIAQSDGERTIVVEYRAVESGNLYRVMAGESNVLGEADLRNKNGFTELTIHVAPPENLSAPVENEAVAEEVSQEPVNERQPAPQPQPEPEPAPAPRYVSPKLQENANKANRAVTNPAPVYIPPVVEEEEPAPVYTPPIPEEEPASPYEGLPCNPNVPHYAQPGCVD